MALRVDCSQWVASEISLPTSIAISFLRIVGPRLK
jgi:hypothetical protein